jgi:hypothetical protein
MAVLLGNNSVQVGSNFLGTADNAYWFQSGYTATGGTMSTAHIEIQAASTDFKICVWDSGGTLVATSAAFTGATTGERSASISGTLTNGNTYYLGFIVNGNYVYYYYPDATGSVIDYEADSYATPGNITIPGSGSSRQEPRMWIEGTASGGGSTGKSNPLSGPLGGPLSGPIGF